MSPFTPFLNMHNFLPFLFITLGWNGLQVLYLFRLLFCRVLVKSRRGILTPAKIHSQNIATENPAAVNWFYCWKKKYFYAFNGWGEDKCMVMVFLTNSSFVWFDLRCWVLQPVKYIVFSDFTSFEKCWKWKSSCKF